MTDNGRHVRISESAFPEFAKGDDEPSLSTSESHTTSTRSEHSRSSSTDQSSSQEDLQQKKRNSYKRKGDYSFRLGDYEKAVQRYSKALEFDTKNHVLLSNRSAANLGLGNADAAIEDAKACIEAQPTDCRGHSRLAVALQSLRQWGPALEAYEKVLELDPKNEIAQHGVELCKRELKKELCKTELKKKETNEEEDDFEHNLYEEEEEDESQEEQEENGLPINEVHFEKVAAPRRTGGMSELSKQLRVLQNTIYTQQDEMDKLERQLRIMSELKGVQKSRVESALQKACQDEAHSELLRQIASLRTQLESMTLLHSGEQRPASFNPSRAIAMLQLRVGELEEVEDNLRDEIRELYLSLQKERETSAKLAAMREQQKKQLVGLLKNVTLVRTPSKQNMSQWAVVAEKKESSDKEDSEALADKLRKAELQLRMERDKAKLLEIQVEAREVEAQLHRDQYKSKLQLQQDRIKELEEQLSSKKKDAVDEATNAEGTPDEEQVQVENESTPQKSLPVAQTTPVPPAVTNSLNALESHKVLSGFLLKRDHKNMIKGWKKRYFSLYRSLGTYQLTYSDGPCHKIKCTIDCIVTGVSTVEQCHEFPKQPYCFVLKVNPKYNQAPVLYAAAASQEELKKWLTALTIATAGQEDGPAVTEPNNVDPEMVARMKKLDNLLHSYGVP